MSARKTVVLSTSAGSAPALVEHGHEVVEGLLGLFGDRRVVEEVAVRRQRDLASCEHEVAVRRRLTVRADRRGAASV